jgi:hypothetical protein
MQKIAAIHDGSPQGWETIYLAFHVAVRLGMPLLVLTLPGDEKQQSPAEQIEKIHTGGRAAGLSVETFAIERVTAEAVLEHGRDLYTLLAPKDLAMPQVQALAGALACPIWVVTGKYEIRRLGLCHPVPSEDFAARYARALAQRLDQPLVFLTSGAGEAALEEAQIHAGITWEHLPEISVRAIEEQVDLQHIDVMIFGSGDASLFAGCAHALTCIVVLCPHQGSKPLN